MRTLFHGSDDAGPGPGDVPECLGTDGSQNQNQNRNQDQDSSNRNNQGERKVIRGVIAGVTVEGEVAIDFRTNRAATAEMSYLTIVGSERSPGPYT